MVGLGFGLGLLLALNPGPPGLQGRPLLLLAGLLGGLGLLGLPGSDGGLDGVELGGKLLLRYSWGPGS